MTFWQAILVSCGVYLAIAIPALLWLCRQFKAIGEELDDGY